MRHHIALPICICLASAQVFDVAFVKPNRSGRMQSSTSRAGDRIVFDNVTLREWIELAYDIAESPLRSRRSTVA